MTRSCTHNLQLDPYASAKWSKFDIFDIQASEKGDITVIVLAFGRGFLGTSVASKSNADAAPEVSVEVGC